MSLESRHDENNCYKVHPVDWDRLRCGGVLIRTREKLYSHFERSRRVRATAAVWFFGNPADCYLGNLEAEHLRRIVINLLGCHRV